MEYLIERNKAFLESWETTEEYSKEGLNIALFYLRVPYGESLIQLLRDYIIFLQTHLHRNSHFI